MTTEVLVRKPIESSPQTDDRSSASRTDLIPILRGASLRASAMETNLEAQRYIAFCESCLSTTESYLRGALKQSGDAPLVWRYWDGDGNECEVPLSELTLKVTGTERFAHFLLSRAGEETPAILASIQDRPLPTGPKDDARPSMWTLVSVIGEQGRACNLYLDLKVATEYPLPKRDDNEGSLRALGVMGK